MDILRDIYFRNTLWIPGIHSLFILFVFVCLNKKWRGFGGGRGGGAGGRWRLHSIWNERGRWMCKKTVARHHTQTRSLNRGLTILCTIFLCVCAYHRYNDCVMCTQSYIYLWPYGVRCVYDRTGKHLLLEPFFFKHEKRWIHLGF